MWPMAQLMYVWANPSENLFVPFYKSYEKHNSLPHKLRNSSIGSYISQLDKSEGYRDDFHEILR